MSSFRVLFRLENVARYRLRSISRSMKASKSSRLAVMFIRTKDLVISSNSFRNLEVTRRQYLPPFILSILIRSCRIWGSHSSKASTTIYAGRWATSSPKSLVSSWMLGDSEPFRRCSFHSVRAGAGIGSWSWMSCRTTLPIRASRGCFSL